MSVAQSLDDSAQITKLDGFVSDGEDESVRNAADNKSSH